MAAASPRGGEGKADCQAALRCSAPTRLSQALGSSPARGFFAKRLEASKRGTGQRRDVLRYPSLPTFDSSLILGENSNSCTNTPGLRFKEEYFTCLF